MYTTEISSVPPKILTAMTKIRKYEVFLMLKFTLSLLLLAVRRGYHLVLNNALILQKFKVLSSIRLLLIVLATNYQKKPDHQIIQAFNYQYKIDWELSAQHSIMYVIIASIEVENSFIVRGF